MQWQIRWLFGSTMLAGADAPTCSPPPPPSPAHASGNLQLLCGATCTMRYHRATIAAPERCFSGQYSGRVRGSVVCHGSYCGIYAIMVAVRVVPLRHMCAGSCGSTHQGMPCTRPCPVHLGRCSQGMPQAPWRPALERSNPQVLPHRLTFLAAQHTGLQQQVGTPASNTTG